MSGPKVVEYGGWKSALTSELACDSSVSLARMYCDRKDNDTLYWTELRPKEQGKTLLFSKSVTSAVTDAAERWTPSDGFDVYDMVHEYGGAAYFVDNGVAYFSNLANQDNHLYKQTKTNKTPVKVTKQTSAYRYADGEPSKVDNFFFCVREDHSKGDVPADVINILVAVNATNGDETVVASGNDFYSTPRVSPDGTKLSWVTWKHNNMPWDNTEVCVAGFNIDGDKITIDQYKQVAGEEGVNFAEPRWTKDNRLLVICDKENWWNLYMIEDLNSTNVLKCMKQDLKRECGQPCWNFGYRSYYPNPANADEVAVIYGGEPALLSLSTGEYTHEIKLDVETKQQHATNCLFTPDGAYLFMQVVSPMEPIKIVRVDMKTKVMVDFHHSAENVVEEKILSVPRLIEYDIQAGTGSDITKAYGYYYPPKNDDFEAPSGDKPPVLLKIHGGPTGSASLAMDLQKQYFTSRGIAIFDLNYRGSTGYGTAFRKELKLKWGDYDIKDALDGALALCKQGLADRNKLLISGGSSGGYTTLACLTFDTHKKRVFAAGTSYYGISDLAVLAEDTHKFESHYCDEMIAPYPEQVEVYDERSPIKHIDDFESPCCFFQGALDMVVPKEQSKMMFDAINEKKIPCAYKEFENEAHGFKDSGNKQTALNGEFYFYSQILGFEPADKDIDVIEIENLDSAQKTKKQKR